MMITKVKSLKNTIFCSTTHFSIESYIHKLNYFYKLNTSMKIAIRIDMGSQGSVDLSFILADVKEIIGLLMVKSNVKNTNLLIGFY